MKSKVIVHRIDSRAFFGFAFFGFEHLSFSGLFVPVSLPEKILLAFMYFQKELDPVTRQALINGSSRKVLRDFAERMGSRYLAQVDSLIDEYEHHRRNAMRCSLPMNFMVLDLNTVCMRDPSDLVRNYAIFSRQRLDPCCSRCKVKTDWVTSEFFRCFHAIRTALNSQNDTRIRYSLKIPDCFPDA